MLKLSNLFALLLVFVLGGVLAVKAQTPAPKAESGFQIFEGGGSYLGVETQEVTKENFSKFGLREVRGVAIEKVSDNSPAKQAGLQDGDVIVRFNGEEVSSFRKLSRLISETSPDHQVKLTVVRGGNERDINVTMGKRPEPQFRTGSFNVPFPEGMGQVFERMPNLERLPRVENLPRSGNGDVFVWGGNGEGGNFVFGSTRQIGVSVSSLSKQLGEYFGVTDGKGILINNVNENSPAAKAGLKAGDVIVEVEGKPVANTTDLIRGIAEKKEGEVSLTILRNKNRQTVKVTPEKMKEGDMPFRISTQPGAAGTVRLQTIPRVNTLIPSVRAVPGVRMAVPSVRTIKRVI